MSEAPDKKPDWTTEKPTEPGPYWVKMRRRGNISKEVVWIKSIAGESTTHAQGSDRCWTDEIQSYWPVKLEPPA